MIPPVMDVLPIDAFLPEIATRVKESGALVIVAEPGAGKTTRVPPALLRAAVLSKEHPNLVMLQPRRVAARAAAVRIAEENGWELGREVGYHVRFERKIGPSTRLRVLTEGILTRQLLDDAFLEGIGAVILDEFHERSLHTDVAIALLREVRETVREDLILIVMSATLDAEPVAAFLGKKGIAAPIVRVPGRTFPVTVSFNVPTADRLPDQVASALTDAGNISAPGETTLVFLPGAEEIRRTEQRLAGWAETHRVALLPLHGSLPFEEQNRALRPTAQPKVILATNIAETSLTIPGVTTVIDTGYARVASYDPRRGLDRLELKRISKASATQRAGRAGRTAPGRCIRLWSEREDRFLDAFEAPEVKRVDLASTVLALHSWGTRDPRSFGWYEAPDERMLSSAERLLTMLGALSSETDGEITPLGKRMMALPVHPRLARLLVESADRGMLFDGATIAALLSEKDIAARELPQSGGPYVPRVAKERGASDLTNRLQLLEQADRDRFSHGLRSRGIDPIAARQVAKTRDDLLRVAKRLGGAGNVEHSDPTAQTSLLSLLAYPDRVCRRRGDAATGVMVGGGGVRLAAESIVWDWEFFVALDARQDERSSSKEALVRIASGIEPKWLEDLFPNSIRREKSAVYDEQRKRIIGLSRVWYRDLLLSEDKESAVDSQTAGAALGAALRSRAVEMFAADEDASQMLARIALLRRSMPEQPWPLFDDTGLGDLLEESASGKRTLDEVLRQPLAQMIRNRLHYPLDRMLDEHAPESIEVPTGNRIKVTYSAVQAPVLAVRLQELFGLSDTPRVAGGRVAVVLHLLGPNYRPVQITEDLRNFWATTYFQVRKDLRARYPKHSWPDDPMTATPQAKGRSRK